MRVYISVDMEGIAGVVLGDHVQPASKEYDRFRRLMTAEANAAIEGAFDAGATEVVVNDGHGPMTNLMIEELQPDAQLISGVNKLLLQMEGIDAGYDALFLVGYHQREGGGDGVLNHTFLGKIVQEIRINGEPIDEAAANAGVAAAYGAPVALIAGDNTVCADAARRFPGVVTAPVKTAIDRYAARTMTPVKARALIRERAAMALHRVRNGEITPITPPSPVTFEVEFKRTAPAHMATLIPNVERRGPRTIAITDDDYVRGYKLLIACLFLGLGFFEGTL